MKPYQNPRLVLQPPPIHLLRVIDINKYCCIEDPSLIFGRKSTKTTTPSPKGLRVINFNFSE